MKFSTNTIELERDNKIFFSLEKIHTVGEFQQAFNEIFPFLKVIFLKGSSNGIRSSKNELSPTILLKDLNQKKAFSFYIDKNGSIKDFENMIREELGTEVQVFRKAGTHWLDTLYTNDWSIEKQNEVGKELSTSSD